MPILRFLHNEQSFLSSVLKDNINPRPTGRTQHGESYNTFLLELISKLDSGENVILIETEDFYISIFQILSSHCSSEYCDPRDIVIANGLSYVNRNDFL